ncbi:MAG: cysteine desulfurase family protein [Patescibacteria group bacterium]|nr:cysteine desulfurase family protein [Patescibacteria group bacterium]
MSENIYFDYAASAPLDPRVAEVMDKVARLPGNPSSVHAPGRELRRRIDVARKQVAALIGGETGEIIFTSGATEANNHAVAGLYDLAVGTGKPGRILISPFEHASVSAAVRRLVEEKGAVVDLLPVGRDGLISAADVARLITPETAVVAVMWVNNILGTIQPIEEVGQAVAEARAARGRLGLPLFFHCDAVQAAGRLPIDVKAAGCDSLSLSAHKIYGPKGVGALWLRRGLAVKPLLVGGGQEETRRSGTENAAGIVGFGAAAEIAQAEMTKDSARAAELRRRLLDGVKNRSGWRVLTPEEKAVPNIVFIQHDREDGETLAVKLDAAGVAVSSGSACDAGHRQPSAAIRAVFGDRAATQGGTRISFGRFTTETDLDVLMAALN